MVIGNENIKQENGVTLEEIQQILAEARTADINLRNKLSKIKIHINGRDNPELIKAIKTIFDSTYIDTNGNSVITYNMYCSVINLLRQIGTSKAEEIL